MPLLDPNGLQGASASNCQCVGATPGTLTGWIAADHGLLTRMRSGEVQDQLQDPTCRAAVCPAGVLHPHGGPPRWPRPLAPRGTASPLLFHSVTPTTATAPHAHSHTGGQASSHHVIALQWGRRCRHYARVTSLLLHLHTRLQYTVVLTHTALDPTHLQCHTMWILRGHSSSLLCTAAPCCTLPSAARTHPAEKHTVLCVLGRVGCGGW